MRSRYSAYQLGLVDYLLDTTDPSGPASRLDRAAWRADVQDFARQTTFLALEVLETEERGDEGRVRFRVRVRQGDREQSYGEDSLFRRVAGRWLYHGGNLVSAPAPLNPGR